MRSENRIFGYNVQYYLKKAGLSVLDLADVLKMPEQEIHRIIGARIYVSRDDQQTIADFLKVDLSELLTERPSKDYEQAGCYECRGQFKDKANRDLVFNIIDMYCDVLEAIEA